MNSYKNTVNCPTCGKLARRNLKDDFARYKLTAINEPQTLGMLADKNTSRMSADEKAALTEKHTAYRRERVPLEERNIRVPGLSYLEDKRKSVGRGQEEKFKIRKKGKK